VTAQAAADARFMALALEQARKGVGHTHPNPAVGAVVVKAGRVIATGHHARAGLPHAEAVALAKAGRAAKGATLYSSLEPCNHHGRTPPCTDAILAAGVRRVVFASSDPNPLVNGSGLKKLKRHGVQVTSHVLRAEADALNRPFFTWMTQRRAHVTLKAAITLDGKLAAASGDSKWITSEAARHRAHQLRHAVDAVLVGAGTVRADDPLLTTRLPKGGGKNPVRLVLEGRRPVPLDAAVFAAPGAVVVTARAVSKARRAALQKKGADAWTVSAQKGRAALREVLEACGRRGLLHVLVEGGADVHGQFLSAGLWDELWLFVAPKLLGGEGLTWSGSLGIATVAQAISAPLEGLEVLGSELLLKASRVPRAQP
jgi:diaminohydroxyphosphoribosylaminopyrimidine deaminase/5-amino-6-(5-phosphoribosylamino)uracil reductase